MYNMYSLTENELVIELQLLIIYQEKSQISTAKILSV